MGLILQTKKIYRDIKDIDLVLEDSLKSYQINYLINNGYEYMNTDFDKCLFSKNGVTIELLLNKTYNHHFFGDCGENKLINYENNFINVLSAYRICQAKEMLYSNRSKDLDDKEFYIKLV